MTMITSKVFVTLKCWSERELFRDNVKHRALQYWTRSAAMIGDDGGASKARWSWWWLLTWHIQSKHCRSGRALLSKLKRSTPLQTRWTTWTRDELKLLFKRKQFRVKPFIIFLGNHSTCKCTWKTCWSTWRKIVVMVVVEYLARHDR